MSNFCEKFNTGDESITGVGTEIAYILSEKSLSGGGNLLEKVLRLPYMSDAYVGFFGSFALEAGRFKASVEIDYNGRISNAKSIIGLISTGIAPGDIFTIRVEGEDEAEALEHMTRFLKRTQASKA